MLSKERGNERSFHELRVRSETGLGAEKALAEALELGDDETTEEGHHG